MARPPESGFSTSRASESRSLPTRIPAQVRMPRPSSRRSSTRSCSTPRPLPPAQAQPRRSGVNAHEPERVTLGTTGPGEPGVAAGRPDRDRRRRLDERARAEFFAGAEEGWRKRTGRPMTAEELVPVLRRYPGDLKAPAGGLWIHIVRAEFATMRSSCRGRRATRVLDSGGGSYRWSLLELDPPIASCPDVPGCSSLTRRPTTSAAPRSHSPRGGVITSPNNRATALSDVPRWN